MLRCPRCRYFTAPEALDCPGGGLSLGFHPPTLATHEATLRGISADGRIWIPCSNRDWRCNWLVADDADAARCLSCRLNRQRPKASDTIALEKLADASRVMRRLLVQLAELGLPVDPFYEREGGLAVDLLSSYSGQQRVTIGHANGVITIDLIETLDDYREGAPEGWEVSYISEYATMHPWGDFAESFAQYLHITDSLTTTAAAGGLVLQASRVHGLIDADIAPRASCRDAATIEMLDDWQWLSLLLNRVNHAMGHGDMHPFTLTEAVRIKLDFVHRVVQDVASRNSGQPVLVCVPAVHLRH